MAFSVLSEELSGGVEMSVLANAGEHIEDLATIRTRVLHAVRGDDAQAMLFRQIAEVPVHPIFTAQKMALDFDVNVFAVEGVDQKLRAEWRILGRARVSRVGGGVSPSRTFLKRLFWRDAKTSTRDECATQTSAKTYRLRD